jgi:hypothetical protein
VEGGSPEHAYEPIWPELRQVIAESPALVLPGRYVIAEVPEVPPGIEPTMTFRDEVETTVIVEESQLSAIDPIRSRGPYIAIRLQLSKPFVTPGLLASAAAAVAKMRVTQIIYSSYSFDYIMVEEPNLTAALDGLQRLGFPIDHGSGAISPQDPK